MHLFKKIMKILGFIALGIVVLLIIASIFIGPIAKNYLEDEINQADQGQYSAQIENVNVSIMLGNFVIEGLRIQTDTVVARENETPVIDLEAGEISVRGLSWLQFLLTDKLQINQVNFLDLIVEAKVRTVDDEEPDEEAGPFRWEDLDIYPMVKDQVDRIRLNDLNFSNLDLTLINVETVDTLTFVAETFNVGSDDILIDADRVFTDARAFYASAIDIQGKDVVINRIGDPQFNLELGLIEFATRESDFGMLSKNLKFFKHGDNKEDTVLFAGYTEFNMTDLDLNTVQEDSLAKIGTVFLNELLVINNFPLDEEEVKRAAEEADKRSPTFDVTEFTLGDNLPELLKSVTITEISLEHIDYRQHDNILVNDFNYFTRHMIIDDEPAFANGQFMHGEQFQVAIDSIKYKASDNSMEVSFRDFEMAMDNGRGDISMNNILANLQGDLDARVKMDNFRITGMDTRDLDEKIFAIDSIALVYPRLTANMGRATDGAANGDADAEMDLYPAIEDLLAEVQINTIAIIDADVRVAGINGPGRTAHIPHLDLTVSDVLIAEGTAFKGDRIMHAKDISLEMENLDIPLPDDIHFVRLRRFDMSTGDGRMVAEGLLFDHRGDAEKHLEDPEVDQVFRATSRRFAISNMNFGSLINEVGFYAGGIAMNGLDVEVFGKPLVTEEEAEEAAKEAERELKFDVDKFTLADNLPDNLGSVYIGAISLTDINIRQEDFIKVGGLEFKARQMAIDSRPAFKENRFLHAKTFRIAMDTVGYIEQLDMMQIALKDFEFDMSNGTGDFTIDRLTAQHEEKIEGELYIDAIINDFNIMGIDTRDMIDRKLAIGEITVRNPKVRANIDLTPAEEEQVEREAEEAVEQMDPDLYPAIEGFLDQLHIGRIAMTDANIELLAPAGDLDIGRLPNINFEITDLLIAEGTAFKGDRVMHAKDIALQMNDIEIPLPDDVHTVSLAHFDLSTGKGIMRMEGLVYDYNENYRKIMEGPETNMVFSVRNELFKIEGMNFSTVLNEIDNLEEIGILLQAITVDGLDVKVLVDNNYAAAESEAELPPTLQQMIKDIEMPFYLGDLSLSRGHIEYEEWAEGAELPGIMTLENLWVNIDDLTNIDSIIGNNLISRINVDVMLQGDGHLRTKLAIPMYDVLQPVRFSGDLDSLDVTTLNRYTEYTTLFGFESGMIYTMRWDFDAGSEISEGIFGLSYEDLEIRLSEPDSPEPAGFLWQVGAYLANALVIDSDISEHKSDPPKKVDFDRVKEEEESFVEHYVSSIIAGLLEIKGFPLDIINP